MALKYLLVLGIAVICLDTNLVAQKDDPLIYQDHKTIYSKLSGQEGLNINLSLLIYSSKTIRLGIETYSANTVNKDTIDIRELAYLPVQNSILMKLRDRSIGSSGQLPQNVLESQSLSTIGLMVLQGQVFLNSYNNVNRDSITSAFNFRVKIPVYISLDSNSMARLFKLVNYTTDQIDLDKKILKDSIENLQKKIEGLEAIQDLQVRADSLSLLSKTQHNLIEESNLLNPSRKRASKRMIDKNNQVHFLAGFVFVKKNELVLNGGFIRTIRITLEDSMELRYRFGGGKVTLAKMCIHKIQDYNFSLDIRSVSSSQRSLDHYVQIRNFSDSVPRYWTKLSEVINYEPPEDPDITELFVPRHERLIFKAVDPVVVRVKETDINNVVQLNIFTDLVGIQENQPNGLVQLEGKFRTHLFNWGSPYKYRENNIRFLEHLEANLKFSKIENKLRYLDASQINGDNKVSFIPNFQLQQYANLETGIKISGMMVEGPKIIFNLYGDLGLLRTGIRDTIYQSGNNNDTTRIPRTYNLITVRKSIESHLQIKATSYTGVELSTEFIWLKLLDKDILQSGGNFLREKNSFEPFRAYKNILIHPQFQVYYLPAKNESQRLYLRAAFFHDLGTRSNSYLTIQVGLSSDINKFLNFK